MDEAELDPRQRRTRAALAAAVLALAAERGIDALSVTEITARAGVRHADLRLFGPEGDRLR